MGPFHQTMAKHRARLKWSLLAGFVLSLGMEILSALITAHFPYRDLPMMPKLVFVYLLFPGWSLGGYPLPRQWWNVVLAVAINSAVYGLLVFGFWTMCEVINRIDRQ